MFDSVILSHPNSIQSIEGEIPRIKFKLSTDTRKFKSGEIFLALIGENFDGAKYIKKALELGAAGVISEKDHDNDELMKGLRAEFPNAFFINVDNSLKYLQQLAHSHIELWKKKKGDSGQIIGITGSNGKTTTKEMLAHILTSLKPDSVYFTPGNFNNHIGVPLTLLAVEEKHDFVIVEMGTNHPGEIAELCKIAAPNSGIITNIGSSHLEFFKNEEAVFIEKRNLYDYVMENTSNKGPFVIKGSDIHLNNLLKLKSAENLISYGDSSCHIESEITVNQAVLHLNKDIINLKNPNIMGKHNFENLVSTFLLADRLVPNKRQEILEASHSFTPRNNRSTWVEENGKKFFLDAYNANPSSMEAALESFVDYLNFEKIDLNRCLFILGDMNELGESSKAFHKNIGIKLKSLKIKNALFVGNFSSSYQSGFEIESQKFSSTEDLMKGWSKLKEKWDYFFIKGSRSLSLESLMEN